MLAEMSSVNGRSHQSSKGGGEEQSLDLKR